MSTSITFATNAAFSVGLSWDRVNSRPADFDLACLAIDSMGLILDACFYNNPAALKGVLQHSGDSLDGAQSGIDESITVNLSGAPPHTYAFVFCIMCQNDGTFAACEAAAIHVIGPDGAPLAPPMMLGQIGKAAVAVVGIVRRTSSGVWGLQQLSQGFPAPARNFMDVYGNILQLVAIDPSMAQELKKQQPVFELSKGDSHPVPVGMSAVMLGLGWDSRCDVDSSCVGLDASGNMAFAVYFGAKNWEGIVTHSGDNTTGEGSGDDEQIRVDLSRMPATVTSIFFTVTVYTAGMDFSDVHGEYCRLVNASDRNGKEIIRFKSLDSGKFNGIVLVALHRRRAFPQQWTFVATSFPAMGRTYRDLVDECQELQKTYYSAAEGPPPRAAPAAAAAPATAALREGSWQVTLVRGISLVAMDIGGTSDPYVIVSNSSGNTVFRSATISSNLNPMWNQSFLWSPNQMGGAINFKVMDKDVTFDDEIGCAAAVLPVTSFSEQTLTLMRSGKSQGSIVIRFEKLVA